MKPQDQTQASPDAAATVEDVADASLQDALQPQGSHDTDSAEAEDNRGVEQEVQTPREHSTQNPGA